MRGRIRKIDRSIFLLIIILAAVVLSIIFFYLQMRIDTVTEMIRKNEEISILFLISEEDKVVISDIFLYYPGTRKGAIVDIPPETATLVESLDRIDRLETLFRKNKLDPYIKKIESLIGLDIRFNIQIDLLDLEKITSLLEGIEIFIASPVEQYSSETIKLLPSGNVVLDGTKVINFLTLNEEGESNAEIISRKQKFLQAFLKRLGEIAPDAEKPGVAKLLHSLLQTDMRMNAFKALIQELGSLDVDRLVFQRTLGEVKLVDTTTLLFPHSEGKLLKTTISQTRNSLLSNEMIDENELNVTIEILNGTLVAGLARRTAQLYQSYGYDVDIIDNADRNDYDKTIIIDNQGNEAVARKIGEIISCKNIIPRTGGEQDLADSIEYKENIDITIIIGKDFDGTIVK